MSQIRACSNQKKHLSVGHDFCGIGMAVINFASSYFEFSTIHNGKKGDFTFEEGNLTAKEIKASPLEDNTILTFKPNKKLFNNLEFTSTGIQKKIEEIVKKFPKLIFTLG